MSTSAAFRTLKLCILASLVASLIVPAFSGHLVPLVWQGFVVSLVYSTVMSVMASLIVPRVVARVGAPGVTLTLAVAGTLVGIAVVGCLVGGALLFVVGFRPLWFYYAQMTRMAVLLILASGFIALSYERLTSELRRTKDRLREQELHQTRLLKQASDARLAALEARVHPHVLFNTLNAVSALIPVDAARAERVVGKLATLLRSALTLSEQRVIPLSAEIAVVGDYLDIEQERLGSRLTTVFDIAPDTRACEVPPFALQSIVENAITHAIAPAAEGGRVTISARRDADTVRIEVSDTGPGFTLASVSSGHGLDAVVERLKTTFGDAAGLEVARRVDGCTVTMRVPFAPVREAAS